MEKKRVPVLVGGEDVMREKELVALKKKIPIRAMDLELDLDKSGEPKVVHQILVDGGKKEKQNQKRKDDEKLKRMHDNRQNRKNETGNVPVREQKKKQEMNGQNRNAAMLEEQHGKE